jgi:hypothetical protein
MTSVDAQRAAVRSGFDRFVFTIRGRLVVDDDTVAARKSQGSALYIPTGLVRSVFRLEKKLHRNIDRTISPSNHAAFDPVSRQMILKVFTRLLGPASHTS